MPEYLSGVSAYPVSLARANLYQMLKVVRALYALSKSEAYCQQLSNTIPPIARHQIQHDAVLMGYDFHLSPSGPKLIEVNTNAGGLWLANKSYCHTNMPFTANLQHKLLHMFKHEFQQWSQPQEQPLKCVAIVDQAPETQFLYPEMQAYAELLAAQGIKTFILDPSELKSTHTGLGFQDTHIDLIYNRHCDFYLHTEPMSAIRNSWLQNQVCLTPNPHVYAMLADKQRMINWSTPEDIEHFPLSALQKQVITKVVPITRQLRSINQQQLWLQRKQWVFKPDTSYASRGVYLGKKLTQSKLQELDPESTLIQEYIPPSLTISPNGQEYKTDFRLFVYQHRALALAARIYQGQVTNLRTEGGGFAPVTLI